MLNGKKNCYSEMKSYFYFFREMTEEQANNVPIFYSQESLSGGPDRLKIESYRSLPYSYSQPQRKSSPTNGMK
jgi:hypothetical protein